MTSPAVSPASLRLGVFCLLFGQAVLYTQSLSPLSVLIWNEGWLGGMVMALTGLSWTEWASHSAPLLVTLNHLVAGVLFLAAGSALLPSAKPRLSSPFLLAGSLLLGLHAFLVYDDASCNPGELMERALFVLSPLILAALLRKPERPQPFWSWLLLAATALTFAGHGLYAAGWWAVPGEWMFLTQSILKTSDGATLMFLKTFGALDVIAACALFVPGKPRLAALAYCVAWGLATALARVAAHYDPAENWHGLGQWAWESLWRMVHVMGPLALIRAELPRRKKQPLSAGLEPVSS